MMIRNRLIFTAVVSVLVFAVSVPARADLPQTLVKVKPSVVGVGSIQPTRNPARIFYGTGFVVGDGLTVVTNVHVLPPVLETEQLEQLVVLSGDARNPVMREAKTIAIDREHDVAVLRIKGDPLPALTLGDSNAMREGSTVAFTGFPLGMLLGLYPATHRGVVAAITPYVVPTANSRQLEVKTIKRLGRPFNVFQLDAIAYPGNSGSPMYDPETGVVYGVLNSVFVKESKENLLKQPSGISYVIPSNHIRELLARPPQ
ncbi:MAG: trypsin-like peptidase domain-containing protein [Burkholderiales bacterium]|nr:trypsin-like peptidase domain-containing protein [Burkholderiales bacterium]